MTQRAAARLLPAGLIALAAVMCFLAGREPRVHQKTVASKDFAYWEEYWKSAGGTPRVDLRHDLLPASLPGPLDASGGNTEHSVELVLEAAEGAYELELAFFEANQSSPPTLRFDVGGAVVRRDVPRGTGKAPPYGKAAGNLSVRVPLVLGRGTTVVKVTTERGSWVAPAGVSLTGGHRFLAAKMAYLLVDSPLRALSVVLPVLAAIFCFMAARAGVRDAVRNLLLLVCSALLSFVLSEVAFRLFLRARPQEAGAVLAGEPATEKIVTSHNFSPRYIQVPSYDADIPYTLRPNLQGFFMAQRFTTNSRGMRGAEIAIEKPAGVLRVLGLGDSYMMGWGVADEDTLPEQVARSLAKELKVAVEPLNLGVPSYNTAVETAVYRKVGRFLKPDLAILMFTDNDFGFPYILVEPVWMTTVRKSYLLERIRRVLATSWEGAPEQSVQSVTMTEIGDAEKGKGSSDPQRIAWMKRVQEHYARIIGKDSVAASLRELGELLRQDGVAAVFVYAVTDLKAGQRPERSENIAHVLAVAAESGFTVVDAGPLYEAYLRERGAASVQEALWVNAKDPHPNAEGHRLMAAGVVEATLAGGLLRPAPDGGGRAPLQAR